MTINATAATLLAMYIVVAEERGIARARLSGTIQNDILKEYIARGTYVYPPEPSMALIADVFRFCADEVPNWNPISISGYHIREAGATAVQELAFTLANTIEYVKRAIEAGLEVDTFAPRLSFFFAAHHAWTLSRLEGKRAPPLSYADRWRHAHRAATPQQRGQGCSPDAGRGTGRNPVAPH
jgi:methylmalonyl-CoA mutase N-terminal domain/subunit